MTREYDAAKEHEDAIRFMKPYCEYAKEIGLMLGLENMRGPGQSAPKEILRYGTETEDLIRMADELGTGICWDTGHGNLTKQDLYETVKLLGSNLHALHVHDNVGYFEPSYRHHRIDMHIPPYATQYASVNYDALIQGLIDIGYKGTFNFEVLTVTRTIRPSFTYNGEVVRTLEFPSLDLWKKANSLVFEIGKYMLESYGLFEG